MLLRSLSKHVKEQNWFAVVLDLAIVVVGVFIGIQVSNWNEARENKEGAVNALHRLRGEVEVNIISLEDRVSRIDENADIHTAAIKALAECDASEQAIVTMSNAVGDLTADIVPTFINNTTKELARSDRYLELLSEDFRNELNIYDGNLLDEIDQLKMNFGLMWDNHIVMQPFVGMDLKGGNLLESTFTFSQPMEVLCKNGVFRRQFAMTIIWHQSTKLRLERFKERSEKFLTALDTELNGL